MREHLFLLCAAAQGDKLVDLLLQSQYPVSDGGGVFSCSSVLLEVQVNAGSHRLTATHDSLDRISVLLFGLTELGQLVGAHALKLSLVEQAHVACFLL